MQTQLSIIMPTYNKEKYIAKALDSILMQETTYKYKIIITDDCSSDKTLEIAKEYSNANPGVIEILYSKENQKLFKNTIKAYKKLQTPYFCVLDPDDYWLDKKKIQKALDFLESHREYTIYCANTLLIKEDSANESIIDINNLDMKNYSGQAGQKGMNTLFVPLDIKKTCTFEDYLTSSAINPHTSSTFFRNVVFKDGFLPAQITNLERETNTYELSMMGDSFRNIIHLHEGKLYYSPEIDSVYFLTSSGVWQSLDDFNQLFYNCFFFKDMWLYYDKKYPTLLYEAYKRYEHVIMKENFEHIFMNDENKLYFCIKVLQNLHMIFAQNEEILQPIKMNAYSRLRFKYRFFLSLYKKLRSKFVRKDMGWLCSEKLAH